MSQNKIDRIRNGARMIHGNYKDVVIDAIDFDRLVEQAERAQKLEEVMEQDARQEVIENMYSENKRYREVIQELNQIIGEAIESIDVGEEVQGLEYAIKLSYETLEGDPHESS